MFFIINIPNALITRNTEMRLRLPAKLVYETEGYDATGPNVTGGLVLFVLKVFVFSLLLKLQSLLNHSYHLILNKVLVLDLRLYKRACKKYRLLEVCLVVNN